ncbi:MAG: hypothetical protein ACOC58_00895 [Chloroflexota bacterium]
METPLTTLMLQRCAETIEQVITPNLTGAYEFEQAMYIAILLKILAPAVEEKTQELDEENQQMRDVLGQVLESLRQGETATENPVKAGLTERLERCLTDVGETPGAVAEENSSLKAALVESIKGLDALGGELSGDTVAFLRGQVRSALRQQLDHGVARVIDRMGGMPL